MRLLTSTALYSDGTYRHILTLRGRACASHVRLVRSSCPLVPVGSICTNLSRRYFFVCRGQATVAAICTYLRPRQFWFCVKCWGARKFSHCKIICIFAFCRSSEIPRTTVFFSLFLNNLVRFFFWIVQIFALRRRCVSVLLSCCFYLPQNHSYTVYQASSICTQTNL